MSRHCGPAMPVEPSRRSGSGTPARDVPQWPSMTGGRSCPSPVPSRPRRAARQGLSAIAGLLVVLLWSGSPAPLRAQTPTAGPGARSAPSGEAAAAAFRSAFERRLEAIAANVDGAMGYCVVDLTSGERISRLGNEPFPTASTIKIAILYELFAAADEGRVALDTVRPLTAGARVGGSGILQELTSPSLALVDYATLMIVLSDNSATNLLIDELGLEAVNRRMRGLGLGRIWLQRRMIDLEAARAGRENLAAPCDIADLLGAVHAGRALSPASRETMLTILRKPKDTPLTRSVPAGVAIASKPGGLEGVAVDAGLVLLDRRPYIVVAMANWLRNGREGEQAIEALGRAAFEYFSRLARGLPYGRMLP